MRHTIKDSLTGWGAQRAQGRGDTGGHPRGMTCQLRVENPALLALSYDSKRDFALAYIFTRKCPLPSPPRRQPRRLLDPGVRPAERPFAGRPIGETAPAGRLRGEKTPLPNKMPAPLLRDAINPDPRRLSHGCSRLRRGWNGAPLPHRSTPPPDHGSDPTNLIRRVDGAEGRRKMAHEWPESPRGRWRSPPVPQSPAARGAAAGPQLLILLGVPAILC